MANHLGGWDHGSCRPLQFSSGGRLHSLSIAYPFCAFANRCEHDAKCRHHLPNVFFSRAFVIVFLANKDDDPVKIVGKLPTVGHPNSNTAGHPNANFVCKMPFDEHAPIMTTLPNKI